MEYIFDVERMNGRLAFKVVVFPLAVSPHTNILRPFSRASHRYAPICALKVPHLMSWVTEMGTALNFLMVKLGPRTLTSSE